LGCIGDKCNSSQKKDFREILTRNITNEFKKTEFLSRSKDGQDGVFSRRRKLCLENLILIILTFKTSIQCELDRFFKKLSEHSFNTDLFYPIIQV